ncbi:MAG: hypothetical protein ACREHG_10655 [Candidatus Saccharimonadales bacterium]
MLIFQSFKSKSYLRLQRGDFLFPATDMETFDDYIIIYLNLLLGANYLLGCLEELEGTNVYRHTLKQSANKLKKELERLTNEDLSKLWGTEDDKMYKVMDYQEGLLKQLATMRPEDYYVIGEIIKKYKQNPTAFQVWAGVKIVEEVC